MSRVLTWRRQTDKGGVIRAEEMIPLILNNFLQMRHRRVSITYLSIQTERDHTEQRHVREDSDHGKGEIKSEDESDGESDEFEFPSGESIEEKHLPRMRERWQWRSVVPLLQSRGEHRGVDT